MDYDARPPKRILDIINGLAQGKPIKIIAYDLGITLKCAQHRMNSAKMYAGTRKDTAVVAEAIRRGWIE